MIPLALSKLILAAGAVASPDAPLDALIASVSTDTRQFQPCALFVALKGERFDGHDFLGQAKESGALAAVVSETMTDPPLPLVTVPDTLLALGALARCVRDASGAKIVGVTGSVGKTTVREMLGLVLGARFMTLKGEGNLNNEIGVPVTLLRLEPGHQAAVVEMAMRGPGEIGYLSRITSPDVAVITNIGLSHVGRLGSIEAIAQAKAEIFEGIRADGTAILHRDDPFFTKLARRAPRVFSFGLGSNSDFFAESIEDRGIEGVRFTARSNREKAEVSLSTGGLHTVLNALSALTAGAALGVSLDAGAAALRDFKAITGRGARFVCATGALVIDDAYNASHQSVKAALDLMDRTPGYPHRTAVLGDMLEMGSYAAEFHRRVGRDAARSSIDRLICVGPESAAMAEEARVNGLEAVQWFPDSAEAAAAAAGWIVDADLILVKGSNGVRMDRIVDALRTLAVPLAKTVGARS